MQSPIKLKNIAKFFQDLFIRMWMQNHQSFQSLVVKFSEVLLLKVSSCNFNDFFHTFDSEELFLKGPLC